MVLDTTLLDKLYAAAYRKDGYVGERDPSLKARLQSARPYIAYDDTTKAAIACCLETPAQMLRELFTATPLADVMWLEWSHIAVCEYLEIPFDHTDGSPQTGVLITKKTGSAGTYYVFETYFAAMNGRAMKLPVEYLYCPDQPIATVYPEIEAQQAKLCEHSAINSSTLLATLTGSAAKGKGMDQFRLDRASIIAELQDFGGIRAETEIAHTDKVPKVVRAALQESIVEFSGVWRTAVSLLYLFNKHIYVKASDPIRNPAKRRFVRGVQVPFLQYRTVEMIVPREVVLRERSEPTGNTMSYPAITIPPGWRAHHRHDAACRHTAETRISERLFRCVGCGRARWKVVEHQRGDASLGVTTKTKLARVDRSNNREKSVD